MSNIYIGINKYTGKTVQFSRKWEQKEFTDEECEKLANGETIEFPYTSLFGRRFDKMTGKLMEITRNNKTFLAFTPVWHYECPPGFGGVLFTEEEKQILESGGFVTKHDFTSLKNGKVYSARVHLDSGKIIPDFTDENGKPLSTNRIKLGAKPVENNKSNPFVNELFKESNNKLSPEEAEENKILEDNTSPPLLSNNIKILENVTLLRVKESGPDTYTLFYSNGVKIIIAKSDYLEYKDIIALSSIDEIIKEYAIEVNS